MKKLSLGLLLTLSFPIAAMHKGAMAGRRALHNVVRNFAASHKAALPNFLHARKFATKKEESDSRATQSTKSIKTLKSEKRGLYYCTGLTSAMTLVVAEIASSDPQYVLLLGLSTSLTSLYAKGAHAVKKEIKQHKKDLAQNAESESISCN